MLLRPPVAGRAAGRPRAAHVHSGSVVIRPGAVLLVLAIACVATPAAAHPAPFSYLDLRLAAGVVTGTLTVHDLDAAYELKLSDADALLDPTSSSVFLTSTSRL